MRRTFLDSEHEARFEREGFVVLPLLAADEVAALRRTAMELHPDGSGFQTDVEHSDAATRDRIEALLAPVWARHQPRLLDDHRVFMSSFLVKWPGPDSDLYLHADTTYVDEERFRSLAFWVALDDADDQLGNGPLLVLPGSHLLTEEYRGSNVVPSYRGRDDELLAQAVSVPVQAGDVVVMDNRLLHASGPNRASAPRVAVAGATVPAEADLVHVVDVGDGLVGVLRVDDEFYGHTSPQRLAAAPPSGPFVAVVPQMRRTGEGPTAPGAAPESDSRPPPVRGTGRLLARALGVNHRLVARAWSHQPGPIYGATVAPWLPDLEAAWPEIRQEYDRAQDDGLRPLPMDLLAGADFGADGSWDAFVLCHNGGRVVANVTRFPRTAAVVEAIPGLRAAMFSVLAPGSSIPPHRGANNGVLRAHLGVVVPGPTGAGVLEVGSCRVSWEEGRAFAFDDSFVHAARNEADDERVVLMIEVDRPLPWPARTVNRLAQWAFSAHPQVRGGQRRIEEVDAAVNPVRG